MHIACPILISLISIFPRNSALQIEECSMVELSYDFHNKTVYWPTAKPFNLETVFSGFKASRFFYAANNYEAAEHGGTHLDAPIHFAKDGKSVEKIKLQDLMGEGCVIDVKGQVAKNRDYLVSVQDIRDWESRNGNITPKCIVLLNTGWSKFYPDENLYLGTNSTDVSSLHFPEAYMAQFLFVAIPTNTVDEVPNLILKADYQQCWLNANIVHLGLEKQAAEYLVTRNITAIGIDTASIDNGPSILFQSHQILAAADIPIFENINGNVNLLPARRSNIVAMPMNLRGGTGAPLRIIAFGIHGDSCGR